MRRREFITVLGGAVEFVAAGASGMPNAMIAVPPRVAQRFGGGALPFC
jgi:hypothetical protein